MSSLIHAIEERVHILGGSNVSVRGEGMGSAKLVVSFLLNGQPRSAILNTPTNRERKSTGLVAAIQKAIR